MRHRKYVGPQKSYDLIAAMTFNLLTAYGLRETHKVLDIGCGSLRNGRLLIQYLNIDNYVGVEPQKWLIEDAIKYEIGEDICFIKRPIFIIDNKIDGHDNKFDYIFAQSIFTHCDLGVMDEWFKDIKRTIKKDGHCFFTYIEGEEGCDKGFNIGLIFKHTFSNICDLADEWDFDIQELDMRHPHNQTWVHMVNG